MQTQSGLNIRVHRSHVEYCRQFSTYPVDLQIAGELIEELHAAGYRYIGTVEVETTTEVKYRCVAFTVIADLDGTHRLFALNDDNLYGYTSPEDVARFYPDAKAAWEEAFQTSFPEMTGEEIDWIVWFHDLQRAGSGN